MINFYEYAARRRKAALPSPEKLLAWLGIDPHGPHDIEVMRMTKQMKKAAAVAPPKGTAGAAWTSRLGSLPRPQ